MNPYIAVLMASLAGRLSYQMARSPVLPRFTESLGAAPELIGVIVAASTITGVLFKLPAGTLSASANDVGATAGPLAGGLVLYATVSFPDAYLLSGVLGAAALLLVLCVPDAEVTRSAPCEAQQGHSVRFWAGLGQVAKIPAVFVVAGVEAAMYIGFGALLGFQPSPRADCPAACRR